MDLINQFNLPITKREAICRCVTVSFVYDGRGWLLTKHKYRTKVYKAVERKDRVLTWRPDHSIPLGPRRELQYDAEYDAHKLSERLKIPFFKGIHCGIWVGTTLGEILDPDVDLNVTNRDLALGS